MYVFWLCGSVSFLILCRPRTPFANAPGCKSLMSSESRQETHAVIWHFYLR